MRRRCVLERGAVIRYNDKMTINALKDVMQKVESWPREAQAELAEIARAMEAAMQDGSYSATPQELAGIDRGVADADAGRFVSDAEVAAVFAKHRRG